MEIQNKENENLEQKPTSPKLPEQIVSRQCCDNFFRLTETDVRDALLNYLSNHLFYKNSLVKQMMITDLTSESVYIYKLETTGEFREKGSSVRPYKGTFIDSDLKGETPGIWDIPAQPKVLFKDSVLTYDIPHTEYVKRCGICDANGYVRCQYCKGSGTMFCEMCRNNGTLMWQGDACYYCKRWGNGGLVSCCEVCDAKRELICKACDGHGFVIQNETVIISWLNKVSERVHKECAIPSMELAESTGQTLVCEVRQNLQPLPYTFIKSISKEMLEKHQGAFPYVLKQRHCLRVVPVTRVDYIWKGIEGVFFVYDIDNKVYFKQFPAKWIPFL